jgi:hypothetical protein
MSKRNDSAIVFGKFLPASERCKPRLRAQERRRSLTSFRLPPLFFYSQFRKAIRKSSENCSFTPP